ncbi:MAG: SprT family zinc-dependent metalloprotease [Pseudomonadota bacterium]
MTSPKINGQQLELFAQDFFAALEPTSKPQPAQPLFKAPPRVVPAPPPPPAPDLSPKRHIQIGKHSLEYVLRRSTRRSIGFTIDDTGLRVTAPKRITLAEIDNAIRAKQRWILSKLHERGERQALRQEKPPIAWEDGAVLPYLGGDITLKLIDATRSSCVFDSVLRTLTIGVVPGLAEWQLRERVRIWYTEEATRVFAERLDVYAQRLGVEYKAFALSSAGTRWGSCTVEGNIRLNWRLIHFALPLIDYVVAHELAHLLEMNHSARFWATVESVYPDYDGARTALRDRSQELPTLFP